MSNSAYQQPRPQGGGRGGGQRGPNQGGRGQPPQGPPGNQMPMNMPRERLSLLAPLPNHLSVPPGCTR
jgi:hypothetical protein